MSCATRHACESVTITIRNYFNSVRRSTRAPAGRAARRARAAARAGGAIAASFLVTGCGSAALSGAGTEGFTSEVGAADRGFDTDVDERATDGEIAAYGALTAIGLGLGAVGTYGMVTAASAPEPTGQRPEFWGGLQGVVGGAVLAVPFGVMTATSVASRVSHDDHGDARPTAPAGVDARATIGLGSIGVDATF